MRWVQQKMVKKRVFCCDFQNSATEVKRNCVALLHASRRVPDVLPGNRAGMPENQVKHAAVPEVLPDFWLLMRSERPAMLFVSVIFYKTDVLVEDFCYPTAMFIFILGGSSYEKTCKTYCFGNGTHDGIRDVLMFKAERIGCCAEFCTVEAGTQSQL